MIIIILAAVFLLGGAYLLFARKDIRKVAQGDDSRIMSYHFPVTLEVGEKATVSVAVKNTGENPWDANYRLGALGDKDSFITPTRIYLDKGEVVLPGEVKEFRWELQVPYRLDGETSLNTEWQMVNEGVGWFGEVFCQEIKIKAKPIDRSRYVCVSALASADPRRDYRQFLDQLCRHNINGTRIFLIYPWDHPAGEHFDLLYNSGATGDFDEEKLRHLRDYVAYARFHGIEVIISLFDHCGFCYEESWRNHPWNRRNGGPIDTEAGFMAYREFYMKKYRPLQYAAVEQVLKWTGDLEPIYETGNELRTDDGWGFEQDIIEYLRGKGVRILSSNSDVVWMILPLAEVMPGVDFYCWHGIGKAAKVDLRLGERYGRKIWFSTDGARGKWSGYQGRPGVREMRRLGRLAGERGFSIEFLDKLYDIEGKQQTEVYKVLK
ncbi:hypothetical protein CEE39_08575 [bacterium (candidate division B38) B3_B38]|nr:MAG: hypothetical protein CEE39_08575 [bacterium (candidate division B38) B3_B38]